MCNADARREPFLEGDTRFHSRGQAPTIESEPMHSRPRGLSAVERLKAACRDELRQDRQDATAIIQAATTQSVA
jgi:hypothetical protein